MIKFTFEIEDVNGTIISNNDGNYLLTAKDTDGNSGQKIISIDEAASILFCSFDPGREVDYWTIAQKALENFPVQLIP